MEERKILIKGVKAYISGEFKETDIYIKGNRIEKMDSGLDINSENVELIYGGGLYALPGFIDLHVHFREPGFSYKETIKTGSEAAKSGGFSTVCTMPNLKPSPDSIENLRIQLDIIKKDAEVNVIPFATITKKRMGNELVDYDSLAPYVAGFSDDGSGVQDEEIMRKAMQGIAKTGKILAAHCEVDSLLEGGYIHKGEYARKNNHKGICSESEWLEVERDIKLSKETGCRLHICHVSTKESVELVRKAKAEGLHVTCETGPHYLIFNDNDLKDEGRFKMNPPIRSEADRQALIEGIIDGTIDVIATDHAPHTAEEKSRGLEKSAMGVVGLETAFPAAYTVLVESGLMDLETLIERMVITPAKILDLKELAVIKEGGLANLTLVNINVEKTVDSTQFKSMGKATPFEGMKFKGWPEYVINSKTIG